MADSTVMITIRENAAFAYYKTHLNNPDFYLISNNFDCQWLKLDGVSAKLRVRSRIHKNLKTDVSNIVKFMKSNIVLALK